MSDQDKQLIIAAIFLIAIGAVASFAFTRNGANVAWKAEMVQRGFAEYSRTTGEWQWKDAIGVKNDGVMGTRITVEQAISLMPKIVAGNAVESALDTIYAEIEDAAKHGRRSLSIIVPLLSHEDDFSLADIESQRVAVCELFARCDKVREDLEGSGFEVEIAPNMVGRWGCSLYVLWADHCIDNSIRSWKAVSDGN